MTNINNEANALINQKGLFSEHSFQLENTLPAKNETLKSNASEKEKTFNSQESNTSLTKKAVGGPVIFKKMFGLFGNLGNISNTLQKWQQNLFLLSSNQNTDILTEKEKNVLRVKKSIKLIDTIAGILVIFNAIVVYYENEDFYNIKYDSNDQKKIIKNRFESTTTGNVLRAIVMVTTLLIDICIFLHYQLSLKVLKIKRLRLNEDNIYSSGLLPNFLIEIFICSICCPPNFDYTFEGQMLSGKYSYSYDALINVITLFKGYLLIRLFQHYSKWNNERAVRACKKSKCQANFAFAMKSELKKRPYVLIAILMIGTIVVLGLAMRTFELSYVNNPPISFDFSYLINSMWLIIITMTTVGFGEGYPSTHLGRFIGVIACIIGMLLISLMVVSLTLSADLTPEETKAFQILKKIYDHDQVKNKAANVIKTLIKLNEIVKSKNPENFTVRFVWVAKLKSCLSVFKNGYRVATSNSITIDDMLINLKQKFETDVKEIKKEIEGVGELERKCASLKDQENRIKTRIENILKMQNVIGNYTITLSAFVDKQIKDQN